MKVYDLCFQASLTMHILYLKRLLKYINTAVLIISFVKSIFGMTTPVKSYGIT